VTPCIHRTDHPGVKIGDYKTPRFIAHTRAEGIGGDRVKLQQCWRTPARGITQPYMLGHADAQQVIHQQGNRSAAKPCLLRQLGPRKNAHTLENFKSPAAIDLLEQFRLSNFLIQATVLFSK
jgi:hypothetical protein